MSGPYSNARLAYVLRKDPFTQEANVIQAMRMVDALAGVTPHMQLPVPSDRLRALLGSEKIYRQLHRHYGFTNRFRVVPVPAKRRAGRRLATHLSTYHRRAIRYLAAHRPDLVITRSERVVRLCCDVGLRVVYETHVGPDEVERLGKLEALCTPASVVGVVTIDKRLADMYAAHGVPRSKLLVLPDGIPQAYLARQRYDKAVARKKLGFDQEVPMVLYAGSLQCHKGIPTLIETARYLPEVSFVLAGKARESIQALAGNQPVPVNCQILGDQPPRRIPMLLDAADICVLPNSKHHPSADYTSPLKLFEYMASGTMIVASAIPAIRQTLDDGLTASLFEPDNAQDLTHHIQTLLSDPDRRRRLAENARKKAADFTWEQRAERILQKFLPQRCSSSITANC